MIRVIKDDKYSEVKNFWKVDRGAQSLINGINKKSNPATENEPPAGEEDPF
jgi:hypothetical protein